MVSGNLLSWSREQCHVIDQLYPYSAVNIISDAVTIEGIADLPQLHAAIRSTIRQLDALRMWSVMGEESKVVSQAQPYCWRDIRHLTFSPDYDKKNLRPMAIGASVDEWFRQPFTLLAYSLFKFVTLTCGEQYSGYLFKAHHGIADDWSTVLLSNHVKQAYEQQNVSDGASPAYSAFLAQQQSYQVPTRFTADRDWWRDYIDEYRGCFLDDSSVVTTEGISCPTWPEPAMINRLYRLCNCYGYTLNTLFTALFALYRARVWEEERGVIGMPLANRHTREAWRCFGMSTNQLSLVYRLVRTERFCGRAVFSQYELKRGFKHSRYPITLFNQNLAEQGGGKLRVLDHYVNYYNSTHECHVADAVQRVESYYSGEQSYKLQIVLQTVNNHRESLRLSLEALCNAFTPRQLTATKNGLLDLITALDRQPDTRLGDLEIYPVPHVALAYGSLKPSSTS